jgi:hypothetical protein
MKKLVACILCVAALAVMALTPSKASAGWGWWGGPGINIYIGLPITDITGTGTVPMAITAIDRMVTTAIVGTDITATDTMDIVGTGPATHIADGTDRRLAFAVSVGL